MTFGRYKTWYYREVPTASPRAAIVRRPARGQESSSDASWAEIPLENARRPSFKLTGRRGRQEEGATGSMEMDLPTEAASRIKDLETQLAALKQKYGVPRSTTRSRSEDAARGRRQRPGHRGLSRRGPRQRLRRRLRQPPDGELRQQQPLRRLWQPFDGGHDSDDDVGYGVNEVLYTIIYSDSRKESDNLRERARVGQKRRRFARLPAYRKAWKAASALAAGMGVWLSMMTTSVLDEIVAPWQDVCVAFSPTHPQQDGERADFLELFAGKARITEAFTRRLGSALRPRDICYGHDLRRVEQQEDVIEEILRERPHLVWAAPPCTAWCSYARLNFSPQERRRRQAREVTFLRFLDRVLQLQHDLGGHFIVKNPRTSELWQRRICASWFKDPRHCEIRLDMCGYSVTTIDKRHAEEADIKLLTTHPAFRVLERHIGGHDHGRTEGANTAHSAHYPTAFGTAVNLFPGQGESRHRGGPSDASELGPPAEQANDQTSATQWGQCRHDSGSTAAELSLLCPMQ